MLQERGVRVVQPDEGYLACGMVGAGRLAAQKEIIRAVREVLGLKRDFEGVKILDYRRARPAKRLILSVT